ncbi:Hypothetical protein MPV1_13 [Marinitoga phage MPV1]|uniref:Uncharacterized protein n=1 Tax=Marinitoga piezophila (strain DSM 14283 / JCM 11233 / KA3) TaxID=443254 RepID=H2J435_MARPK|nr:hypothetical protein [Marinitoga piezophila]AEX84763.1 hypothetical protein Marpi_0312 [Marinitoga piezophila KA3]
MIKNLLTGLQFIIYLYKNIDNIDEPYTFDIQGYVSDTDLVKQIVDEGIQKGTHILRIDQGLTEFYIYLSKDSMVEKKVLNIITDFKNGVG